MKKYDLICIGAGPTGLACAIEATRVGLTALVIDKGALCNSLLHYPVNMVFFTTPELLEIGDLPLVCAAEKPTRLESLKYYRKTAEHFALEVRLYEQVTKLEGSDGNFFVSTVTENGTNGTYRGAKIAVATGYYDLPNELGVPGENLPHVSHYYTEPHPYWNQDVVVVGGKNSAAEAALDLWRNGARVTMVHRDAQLGATIKYWVKPDIENRVKAGQIPMHFKSTVKEITNDAVIIESPEGNKRLPAKQLFLLTGYHPDFAFIESLGVRLDPVTRKPAMNPETHESNIPGVYLAGVVIGGRHTSEIFIENGRFHGKQIALALTAPRAQTV
ncbi:MAG: YpdA family putative bacillithiol disulfide reductase [Acidobacteria bacterium]|jgi:thioredoxin reductase (NADPH)|nr:MAG: YpdA family putative bacillithiol disulfide reductase [Acidobacteriota bacterium]